MRIINLIIITMLLSITAWAQQTPQFSYFDFEGWTYSGGTLTNSMVSRGVYLYVTSQGKALTLTSPEFSCQGIDSITVVVLWKSNDPSIALTTAIDDPDGLPVDSITSLPASSASLQRFTITLPIAAHGLTAARLRFVSWGSNVDNTGAIRTIETTAIISSHEAEMPGDVNGDGQVNITDVTVLIDYLLSGTASEGFNTGNADVDGDGNTTISDITILIDKLLSSKREQGYQERAWRRP